MIVALIDNGSLEPAALQNLRAVAAALAKRTGVSIHAVSWKHSDRIPPAKLRLSPASDERGDFGAPVAWTLDPFLRSLVALGQREFVFVPFFISAQGAIGSALRTDLERIQRELGGFEFRFTDGLAARGVIPKIVAEQIRLAIAHHALHAPPVIVVDHGGPSPASATLRDQLAAQIRRELGAAIGPLAAASMEGAHPPLLAAQLRATGFAEGDVIVAPLFLSPGRHAGPQGDLARICHAAGAQCHLTGLVGTHPLAVEALAAALQPTLATLHAYSFA